MNGHVKMDKTSFGGCFCFVFIKSPLWYLDYRLTTALNLFIYTRAYSIYHCESILLVSNVQVL